MTTRYITQAWCPDGVMRRASIGGSPTAKRTNATVRVGGIEVQGSCYKGKPPDDYPKPPSSWSGWYFYPLTGPGAEVMGYTVENRLDQIVDEQEEKLQVAAGRDTRPADEAWGFDFDDDLG